MNAYVAQPSMRQPRFRSICLTTVMLACASCTQLAPPPSPNAGAMPAAPPAPHPLAWDAMEKTYAGQAGESLAEFAFTATNRGASEVVVSSVEPSCGCTVADLPAHPWRLAPGASGTVHVKVDFSGRRGELIKSIVVHTDAGKQTLQVKLSILPGTDAERARNHQMAQADRQAIFRGDCARCHAAPASGKMGYELFQAACAICHAAPHRASIVPDLMVATTPRDAAFWQTLIADGRPQKLMPSFAQAHGGPLSKEQIKSLVDYALSVFPSSPNGTSAERAK